MVLSWNTESNSSSATAADCYFNRHLQSWETRGSFYPVQYHHHI